MANATIEAALAASDAVQAAIDEAKRLKEGPKAHTALFDAGWIAVAAIMAAANLPEPEWDAYLHALGLARKNAGGRWTLTAYNPRLLENVGAAVVVYCPQTDEVLYEVRRDNGKLGHLGGGAKAGEALLDAARRELKEESGLTKAAFIPISSFGYGTSGKPENPRTTYSDGEERVHRGMLFVAIVNDPAVFGSVQKSIESKNLVVMGVNDVDPDSMFDHGQMVWRLFKRWHALQGDPSWALVQRHAAQLGVTPLFLN